MKRSICLFLFAVVLSGALCGCRLAGLGAQEAPLTIAYNRAGLTIIDVKDGRLSYTWHTLKRNLRVPRQDMSSYDRHGFEAQLTSAQQQLLRDWVARRQVLTFAKRYPPADPDSYGAAFHYSLSVAHRGKARSVAWDGTSKCPQVNQAADALVRMANEIRDAGRKQR